MAAYLQAGGIKAAIEDIHPDSAESLTRSLWLTLLPEYFSAREGYKLEVESLFDEGKPDIVLIKTQYSSDPAPNGDLLIIETKRASLDTQSTWYDTHNFQLWNYLSDNRNVHRSCYGAVAIGRRIKFFRWDGTQLHTLTNIVHIEYDSLAIERQLLYFKHNPRIA